MPEVSWRGPAVSAALRRNVVEAMDRITTDLAASSATTVGRPYPPASSPGRPPHRRSGRLRRSQAGWVSTTARVVEGRVGVAKGSPAARYAAFVALGTRRMARRPWLPQVLADNRAAVLRSISDAARR